MSKRKTHSSEFKASIVLEALSGEATVSRLAAVHDINPSLIHRWIKEAKSGLPGLFEGKEPHFDCKQDKQIRLLHEKIGQLTVERDYLMEVCGRNSLKKTKGKSPTPIHALGVEQSYKTA